MTENNIDILAGILWRISMNFILISLDYWKKNRQQSSDDTGIKINIQHLKLFHGDVSIWKRDTKHQNEQNRKPLPSLNLIWPMIFLFFCCCKN